MPASLVPSVCSGPSGSCSSWPPSSSAATCCSCWASGPAPCRSSPRWRGAASSSRRGAVATAERSTRGVDGPPPLGLDAAQVSDGRGALAVLGEDPALVVGGLQPAEQRAQAPDDAIEDDIRRRHV